MKRIKKENMRGAALKATSYVLTLAILLFAAAGTFAEPDPQPINEELEGGVVAIGGNVEAGEPGAVQEESAYSKLSGKVSMIDVWNDSTFFRITDGEGAETDFVIDESRTVFSDLDGLVKAGSVAVGSMVDAYFVKPVFMTLQYPPRFTASVVVVRPDSHPGSAYAGVVNNDWRASDGSVVLNISDDTAISLQSDGKKADKSALKNRVIIAYFAVTTRSLPPIALVQKVIVLDNLGVPVFVNGTRLFDGDAIANANGTLLVPLRAVVEALGFEVNWDGDNKTARIGVATYVKIGSDEYTVGRAMPLKLDAAAELINWRTYVPLSFFTTIMQMELNDSNGLLMLTGKAEG